MLLRILATREVDTTSFHSIKGRTFFRRCRRRGMCLRFPIYAPTVCPSGPENRTPSPRRDGGGYTRPSTPPRQRPPHPGPSSPDGGPPTSPTPPTVLPQSPPLEVPHPSPPTPVLPGTPESIHSPRVSVPVPPSTPPPTTLVHSP